MYYITAGLLAKMNSAYAGLAMEQYGYTAEQLESLNVSNYLLGNLVPVTIGNILGGILCIGLPLFYLNRDKASKEAAVLLKEEMRNDVVYGRSIADIGR